jgi:hypothetical protein
MNEVTGQIIARSRSKICIQVKNRISYQIMDLVWNQVRMQIDNQIKDKLWNQFWRIG